MAADWSEVYRRFRSLVLTWGVFAVGLAITATAWVVVGARVEGHARTKAENAMLDAVEAIHKRVHSSYDIVYGVQGLFRASEDVTRAEFRRYASGL